jgi:hypothetical protein
LKEETKVWAKEAAKRVLKDYVPRFGGNRNCGNAAFAEFYRNEHQRTLKQAKREKINNPE